MGHSTVSRPGFLLPPNIPHTRQCSCYIERLRCPYIIVCKLACNIITRSPSNTHLTPRLGRYQVGAYRARVTVTIYRTEINQK